VVTAVSSVINVGLLGLVPTRATANNFDLVANLLHGEANISHALSRVGSESQRT